MSQSTWRVFWGGRCWYPFKDDDPCVGMFGIQHDDIANQSNLCSPRDALLNAAALLSSLRDCTRDVEFALEKKKDNSRAKDSLERVTWRTKTPGGIIVFW